MLDRCRVRPQAIAIGLLLTPVGVARAATYDMIADAVYVTLGGAPVLMWGFGFVGEPVTVPGPVLDVPAGEDLTINLTNQLDVPVSIVVPGLGLGAAAAPVVGADGRVQTFSAAEAGPGGGMATYTFEASTKPGTRLYESGTDPGLHIPMGLYGAVVVRPATPGQAYDAARSAFDVEKTLVFSEVDPALNAAVEDGTFGTPAYPSTVHYAPRFFLINGLPFDAEQPSEWIGRVGDQALLRLVNAGSISHSPTVNGLYAQEIAQDGNLLRFAQDRIVVLLHAGMTMDVVFRNSHAGEFALYDRRLFVAGDPPGGMIKLLRVSVNWGLCGICAELILLMPPLLWLRGHRKH